MMKQTILVHYAKMSLQKLKRVLDSLWGLHIHA